HTAHALEAQHQLAVRCDRTSGQARAAARGHHRHALRTRPAQHGLRLSDVAGQRYRQRRRGPAPRPVTAVVQQLVRRGEHPQAGHRSTQGFEFRVVHRKSPGPELQPASGTGQRPAQQCSIARPLAHWGTANGQPPPMKTSYPRKDIRVLLLEGLSPSAVAVFRDAGYSDIEAHAGSLPEAMLRERVREAHIIGIRSRTQLTAEVLADARRLMAVGCFCIGTNQVDLEAAARQGVPVFNAPYSNTRSVAELVLAETIMLMRGVPARHAACLRGDWLKSATGSHEVRGKTLGIVGYGHIGTQVGLLAEGLGMRVLFHDVEAKLSLGNARAAAGLDDLLARADVVTLHVPETPATRMMIGATELAAMKPGVHLVNA